MDKIHICIIGSGIMAEKHLLCYMQISNVKVVGIADIVVSKAQKLATLSTENIPTFTDYQQMITQTNPDAVHVATPDHLHYEPVSFAIRCKKHVLVEKPLATSFDHAQEIVALAKEYNVFVMLCYSHRWASPYQGALTAVENGQLGVPLMVYARKNDTSWVATEMMNWAEHTSCASYLSTHDIDIVLWLLNTKIRSVYALGVKKILVERGIDTYDSIQALVEFENGAIGTFESTWLLPNTMPATTDSYVHLIGSEGTIQMNRGSEGLFVSDSKAYTIPRLSLFQKIGKKYSGAIPSCLEYFISCIAENQPPQPNAEHGMHIVQASSAIVESINTGKCVLISEQ